MKFRLCGILLFIISALSFHTSRAQAELSSDSIRNIIKNEVDNKRCPSIVVGIINEKGKEVISYGKLNKNGNQPADGNTIYEIGSVSKVFTSLLLELMAENGDLSLDDPISKYLPANVLTPSFEGREITLLDLSTQRSGLPRLPDNINSADINNPYASYTVQRLYDFLSKYKLTVKPGDKYEYSNLGAGLLGHILSLKAGKDYESLVIERICKPLNMTSTSIKISPENKTRFASGYSRADVLMPNWDLPTLAGAGALRSTVNDMLNFLEVNLKLKKTDLYDALEKIQTVQASTGFPDVDVAMGWHINNKNGSKIIFHNGATGGYCSFIGIDKEKRKGVVVFANSSNIVDDIGFHLLNSKYQLNISSNKISIADTLIKMIFKTGIESAVMTYKELYRDHKGDYVFSAAILNNLANQFLRAKKIKTAEELYKLSTETYPDSPDAYEKLGDIYSSRGENEAALNNYKKVLELNPANINANRMIDKLKDN